jgi:transcriptional regulator with XRE-family HTH domain
MNIKDLDTFGKRLKFILELKEIRNKDLASALNLAPNSVSSYCNDQRNPDLKTLAKIADFLNVNSDFLLMRSDNYNAYIKTNYKGKEIAIEFNDSKLTLTEEQIKEMLSKLDSVGFDVNKLLNKEEN